MQANALSYGEHSMTLLRLLGAVLLATAIPSGLMAAKYGWNDFEIGAASESIVPVTQKTITGRQLLINGVAVTPNHLILPLPNGTNEQYSIQEGGLQLLSRYEDLNLALFHNPEANYVPVKVAASLGDAGRIVTSLKVI